MALLSSIPTTIRFYVLMAPMIILGGAVWQTFLYPSWKAPLYILGSLLTTLLGRAFSSSFPNRVPGFLKGAVLGKGRIKSGSKMFDPACNILEKETGGWGTFFSSPEPHALFFAFSFIYLTMGMFLNNQYNWLLIGFLILITLASGYLRTSSPLLCANYIDLFLGYSIGMVCGLLFYIIVYSIENMPDTPLDLTYFNSTSSDSQKCKMENKKFVCSKVKK